MLGEREGEREGGGGEGSVRGKGREGGGGRGSVRVSKVMKQIRSFHVTALFVLVCLFQFQVLTIWKDDEQEEEDDDEKGRRRGGIPLLVMAPHSVAPYESANLASGKRDCAKERTAAGVGAPPVEAGGDVSGVVVLLCWWW